MLSQPETGRGVGSGASPTLIIKYGPPQAKRQGRSGALENQGTPEPFGNGFSGQESLVFFFFKGTAAVWAPPIFFWHVPHSPVSGRVEPKVWMLWARMAATVAACPRRRGDTWGEGSAGSLSPFYKANQGRRRTGDVLFVFQIGGAMRICEMVQKLHGWLSPCSSATLCPETAVSSLQNAAKELEFATPRTGAHNPQNWSSGVSNGIRYEKFVGYKTPPPGATTGARPPLTRSRCR